jgi:hypothetical protein
MPGKSKETTSGLKAAVERELVARCWAPSAAQQSRQAHDPGAGLVARLHRRGSRQCSPDTTLRLPPDTMLSLGGGEAVERDM